MLLSFDYQQLMRFLRERKERGWQYIRKIKQQQIANHDKVFLIYLSSPTIILWRQTVPYTWAVGKIESSENFL